MLCRHSLLMCSAVRSVISDLQSSRCADVGSLTTKVWETPTNLWCLSDLGFQAERLHSAKNTNIACKMQNVLH